MLEECPDRLEGSPWQTASRRRRSSYGSVSMVLVMSKGSGADELGKIVVQGVFVALLDSELHALVSPKALEGIEAVQRHWFVGTDLRVGRKYLSKTLVAVSQA